MAIIALFTLGVVVFGSLLFRGFLAAMPVLMGVIAGYVLAVIINFWVPGHDRLRRDHGGPGVLGPGAGLAGL